MPFSQEKQQACTCISVALLINHCPQTWSFVLGIAAHFQHSLPLQKSHLPVHHGTHLDHHLNRYQRTAGSHTRDHEIQRKFIKLDTGGISDTTYRARRLCHRRVRLSPLSLHMFPSEVHMQPKFSFHQVRCCCTLMPLLLIPRNRTLETPAHEASRCPRRRGCALLEFSLKFKRHSTEGMTRNVVFQKLNAVEMATMSKPHSSLMEGHSIAACGTGNLPHSPKASRRVSSVVSKLRFRRTI